jgi:2-oxoglutarate dehydrogenase E2 component (dihydrolipoamide succinyltransferase)
MFAHKTLRLVLQGTIVEWVAQLGEAVKDGDVIAMVETDKVTIDIKAEMDGVITQQFGAV